MNHLINAISSNITYITILVIVVALILYFILKKLFKMVIYCVLLFGCFLAYVHYTGGDVKNVIEKSKNKSDQIIKKI